MATTSTINHRWWAEDVTDPGPGLVDSCTDIADRDRWRTQELRKSWRLYAGRKFATLRAMSRPPELGVDRGDGLIRYNVVASIVETIVAKMSKSRPAPQFVTNGADWKTRRLTEKLNKFGQGVLYASGVYDMLDDILKEWAASGTAVVKFCSYDKEIRAERVLPWELFIPPWEAERGDPKTFMQRTPVDRHALMAMYGSGDGKGKRLAAIEQSRAPERARLDEAVGDLEEGSDMVFVYEGWRVGCKGRPGRHVIAVEGGTLVDEEYKPECAPFAVMRYVRLPGQWWGTGVPSRQAGKQFEINNLLQKIQLNTHMLANPVTFVESLGGIPKAQLTNDIGSIVELPSGTAPPTRLVLPVMPPEVYNQVESYIQKAYEEEGVSQLSASARKPAGIDAAVALREYSDIESERFTTQGRELERFIIQCVERCIDLAETIPGYEVDTMDRRWNERLRWSDIRIAEDKFVLRCFPISSLPQNPAARRQTIQEYVAAGWITPDKGKELMDLPDLEEGVSVETGSIRYVRKQIAGILDGEPFQVPEPDLDLQGALKYALGVYNLEMSNGMPEDIADALRDYISQIRQMIANAEQAQAPMAPPMPVDPMAAGPVPSA